MKKYVQKALLLNTKKLVFVFLFFNLLMLESCDSNAQHYVESAKIESAKKGECDQMWRLDAIVQDAYREDETTYVTRVDTFIFEQDSILKKTISYTDYSDQKKKFGRRTEVRYNEKVDLVRPFTPTLDPRFSSWEHRFGSVIIHNDSENKKEKYEFKFNYKTEEWNLIEHIVDSFDTRGILIQQNKFSDSWMGRSGYVESKENFEYNDTVLIKKEKVYRREGEGPEWQHSSSQIRTFKEDRLVEDMKYVTFSNEKYIKKRRYYEYGEHQTIRIFEEYSRKNKLKRKNKTVELLEKGGEVVQSDFFSWDSENENFVLSSTTYFERENEYEKERKVSIRDSIERIKIVEWDSNHRKTRSYSREKNIGEINWESNYDFRYFYEGSDTLCRYREMYDEDGEIERIDSLYMDDRGNPKKRKVKSNKSTLETLYIHDHSIDSKCVVNPSGISIFEVDFFKSFFNHTDVLIRSERYLENKNGQGIYRAYRYVYSPIQ
ncbi:MAG: hypothetical protein P1U56_12620 [Saprospiraceae bacterium]|nr:hypothetical protein [Saprospiraceae bacterium]